MTRRADTVAVARKARSFAAGNGPFYVLGLLAAAGLKLHYSGAGPDDLGWILLPTARLVELLAGIRFAREIHAGLIDHGHRIVIGTSCAGINFLTIAFCTLFFTFVHRFGKPWRKLAWLGACGAVAFALAAGANALRIVAAIRLYGADIYGGWATPERVHRIGGTLVYFTVLLAAYFAVDRIVSRAASRGPRVRAGGAAEEWAPAATVRAGAAPFFWYALIALGIPLAHADARGDRTRLLEHCLQVVPVCLGLLVLVPLVSSGYRRLAGRLRQAGRQ